MIVLLVVMCSNEEGRRGEFLGRFHSGSYTTDADLGCQTEKSTVMFFDMAALAEPFNVERFAVIVMMAMQTAAFVASVACLRFDHTAITHSVA